ncbi:MULTISPECIES: imelysin family protein [unclassified Colwellia]|jgi:putative iron-regulated protein|uniref:imelysin family protein n=1 Tax=unclassified Colwellia TaxID=196834 RepID=UPI0015F4BC33|nr:MULTISPECIES: imelysin family protein [unclassified Colwellia]MBA6251355.1 metalloproteinase [Colwellia sp. MB3u-55]MBA6399709.1 metalloproteinase [Colwellia sp. BRX10-4]
MNFGPVHKITIAILLASALTACVDDGDDGKEGLAGTNGVEGAAGISGVSNFVTREDVIITNANIAYAAYSDSLFAAITLRDSLATFVATPTSANFFTAKESWKASREPYGQTEVYRFRGGPIDTNADGSEGGVEGALNAWPLGEAVIDYIAGQVDGDDGIATLEGTNIIAGTATIDKALLEGLFEKNGDADVTTGYHAIEFLLWGQDLNDDLTGAGVRDNTPGQRPVSDYALDGACTSGAGNTITVVTCQRRGQYLMLAADILIEDLKTVVNAWEPQSGSHYKTFVAGGDESLGLILEGMGRLSYGELGSERINIALINNSQEDEHSCFSDNTHRDIFLNAKGVQNTFNAKYTRIDGEVIEGASIYDLLVTEGEHVLANKLRGSLEATMSAAAVIDTKAKMGIPFDVLTATDIEQPNVVAVIAGLVTQTDDIEQVIDALGVTAGDLKQDGSTTIE